MTVNTVGHSTHPIEEFIRILQAHGIRQLVDVRTIPRSRRNPQFNRENLPASLQTRWHRYLHLPGLGGLRHPRKDSINTGWRNASFRGYADYMQTAGIRRKPEPAHGARLRGPHRDHVRRGRSLAMPSFADRRRFDRARNPGLEILSATKSQPHAITPFAKVEGQQVTYPAAELELA